MKAKALQFGKALSAALFVLLLTVAGTKNALAQTLVATLQHGDSISFFYGADALRNAHDAAEAGDIITLSSGSFASPYNGFVKAITLRGAGCVADSISGVQPTVIHEMLFHEEDEGFNLTVEGICFTGETHFVLLSHPKFVKCNFDSFSYWWNTNSHFMDNAQFDNCKFGYFGFDNTTNTTFINCVIWSAETMDDSNRTVTAFNSILRLYGSAAALSAYNCIITCKEWGVLQSYSVAYNCIGIKLGDNYGYPLFNVTTFDCVEYDNYSDVFESFEGFENDNFDYTEPFILKSDIATSFLGNDGTEVGLYGGFMPYTSRPSYQIVKHYNVPNKSDAQGHLNVGIELYSGDE